MRANLPWAGVPNLGRGVPTLDGGGGYLPWTGWIPTLDRELPGPG